MLSRAGCSTFSGQVGREIPRVLYFPFLSAVAINLIVQHIQDILNGDICKWQRGAVNGHGRTYKRPFPEQTESSGVLTAGKRSHLESSSRPH